jgi:uncharacterized protein (TIGR03437 family)
MYVSPSAVRFYMPADVQEGIAEVIVTSQDGYAYEGLVSVERNAARIMTVNDDDNGSAVVANGLTLTTSNFDVTTQQNFSSDTRTRLSFFATGVSGSLTNTDLSNDVSIGGVVRTNFAEGVSVEARLSTGQVMTLAVEYAGAQGVVPGLDQITVVLPSTLKGAGTVQLTLIVGGRRANAPSVVIN